MLAMSRWAIGAAVVSLSLRMAELRELAGKDCADDNELVCTPDGKRAFRIAPHDIHPLTVKKARAGKPVGSKRWVVDVQVDKAGTALLRKETRKLTGSRTELGVLNADDAVLVAATVTAPISGGQLELGGDYTRAQAEAIADELDPNAP